MGACCSGATPNKGEDYITEVLSSENFFLKDYYYKDLKEKINSIPSKELTDEFNLRKNLYPILFEQNKEKNKYIQIHKGIINELLSKVKSNPSTNNIIFWLFPYLNHINEKNTEEILYDIFTEENEDQLNIISISELLDSYIDNCTILLTFAFWNIVSSNDLKNSYDEMNSIIYTNEHKNKLVEKILEDLKNKYDNYDLVTVDIFSNTIKPYQISNYRIVRSLLGNQFGVY